MSWGKSTIHLESRMDFGKYAGRKLVNVIDEDIDYINWCIREIDGFVDRLSDEAKEEIGI